MQIRRNVWLYLHVLTYIDFIWMKVLNALTLSLARLWCEISLKGCSWLELASPWAAGQPVLAAPVWWHPELRWDWALCLLAVSCHYLALRWLGIGEINKINQNNKKKEALAAPTCCFLVSGFHIPLSDFCLLPAVLSLPLPGPAQGQSTRSAHALGCWQLNSPWVGLGEQPAMAPAPGGADQRVR